MKKEWEHPELIVLIKTELEEDVLAACKASGPVQLGGCEAETPTSSIANS
jgi:hypothetical protein